MKVLGVLIYALIIVALTFAVDELFDSAKNVNIPPAPPPPARWLR
jgi:hypothetical protein